MLESRHRFYWDKSNESGLFEAYRKKHPEYPARDQRHFPGWMETCVPEFRTLTFRAVKTDKIFQNPFPSRPGTQFKLDRWPGSLHPFENCPPFYEVAE